MADNFSRADKIVQEVKAVVSEEVIPAIAQLRYAGFHFVEWVNSEDKYAFLKAESHSKRAIFEAARYGIFSVVSK